MRSGFGRIIGEDKLPGNSVTQPSDENREMAEQSPGRDTPYIHDLTKHPFAGMGEEDRRFMPQWMVRLIRYQEAKKNRK